MIIAPKKHILNNDTPVIIRSPSTKEAKAYLDYLQLIFEESYEQLAAGPDSIQQKTIQDEKEFIAWFLSHNKNFILSAFHKKKLIGSLTLRAEIKPFKKHNATIGIAILKDWQNLGLGKILIEECVAECLKNNIINIKLQVRTKNTPGIRLYKKMGFELVGTLKSEACVDDKFVDEYLFQRILQ